MSLEALIKNGLMPIVWTLLEEPDESERFRVLPIDVQKERELKRISQISQEIDAD